jgi:hypothetical protein
MGIRKLILWIGLLVILSGVALWGLPGGGVASLLAAPLAGPSLVIPDLIPSNPGGSVVIPVTFDSNGEDIASIIFSIDYDERYLTFDPGVPNAVVFNLPSSQGFVSNCELNKLDLDGEMDCYVTQLTPPLDPIPDGVLLQFILQVGTPASPVIAPVGFSNDPAPSFGDTTGQSVPAGLIDDGSVEIGEVEQMLPGWLPLLFKAAPYVPPTYTPTAILTRTPTPTATGTAIGPTITATPTRTPTATLAPCSDIILNGGFEKTTDWVLPITEYSAVYSNARVHSGSWSVRTGIVDDNDDTYSYSEVQQTVFIPADTDSASLNFWVYPISDDNAKLTSLDSSFKTYGRMEDGLSLAEDLQYALVIYNGYWYFKWYDLRDTRSWEYYTVSLAEFAGTYVTIDFGTFNNGYNGPSALYVDDVSFTICR